MFPDWILIQNSIYLLQLDINDTFLLFFHLPYEGFFSHLLLPEGSEGSSQCRMFADIYKCRESPGSNRNHKNIIRTFFPAPKLEGCFTVEFQ